jgi:Protein of unknown function (DUF4238)
MTKEAKSAVPRKHHYVPQFYLRGFAGDKAQLFVIDRSTETPFRTDPKNVAAERDFNTVDVEGMAPDAVEKGLAEFEGEIAPAIERIKTAKSLSVMKDRDLLMNLICALAIRNPRQRTTINDFVGEIAQQIAQLSVGTEERWNTLVAQMKADGVWDESTNLTYEDMKKFVQERNYKIQVAKEFNIAMEIEQHEDLLQHIAARKWQIVIAKAGSGGFVTTDVPVCLRWSGDEDHGIYAPGFGLEDTQVIFPLSTDLALMGSFEGEEDVVEADIFTVGRINSVIISSAEKQVYAHDYSFNYMRPFPQAVGSGATLIQDKAFLDAGKPKDEKIVQLRTK